MPCARKLTLSFPIARDAARLRLEGVDEQPADRLAFGLGIDAFQRLNERLGPVDMNQRDVEMAANRPHHFVRFARPMKSVVDEHTGELIADRLVNEYTAATAELTLPDKPQITRALPTCARMRAISSSRKAAIVQLPLRPATLNRKLVKSFAPSGV